VLIPPALVENGNWSALTNRARAFVEFVENPHKFAARFLAMMGIAPRPKPAQSALPAPAASLPGAPGAAKSRPGQGGDTEGWIR
jgi:hypothetical protein